jgi:alpha-amylase
MSKWWIDNTGIDGFRLDAVKHIPISFWMRFSNEIHEHAGSDFIMLGEVFRGIPEYLAKYQRDAGIDSVFDVPFSDTIRSALCKNSESPGVSLFKRLWELTHEYRTMLFNEIIRKIFARKPTDMRWFSKVFAGYSLYMHPDHLATIIDNHDLSRFITEANGSTSRLKMALTILFTWRGIPVITYGTETAMSGRTDGSNRDLMKFGVNTEMTDFCKTLIRIRRSFPALNTGFQTELMADKEIYIFMREGSGQRVIVAINNSGREQSRTLIIPAWIGWNDVWTDPLSGLKLEVRNGNLNLIIDPESSKIIMFGIK